MGRAAHLHAFGTHWLDSVTLHGPRVASTMREAVGARSQGWFASMRTPADSRGA